MQQLKEGCVKSLGICRQRERFDEKTDSRVCWKDLRVCDNPNEIVLFCLDLFDLGEERGRRLDSPQQLRLCSEELLSFILTLLESLRFLGNSLLLFLELSLDVATPASVGSRFLPGVQVVLQFTLHPLRTITEESSPAAS